MSSSSAASSLIRWQKDAKCQAFNCGCYGEHLIYRKEVQRIFDKYVQNNVRRLKKAEATEMLEKEFNMTSEQASSMFDAFDQDKNGIMSIWEFQQFYQCVGNKSVCLYSMQNNFKTL